ncbi:hypothetical protein AFCDBAGC_5051 [Methylobacterium cerastii]|uniref:Uncharacterized protein n=1 Tax=Methylobacterium cerastii TaxID=932741 RepID=A0ABQ4QQJ0_9HYPH|nr:hypothetical protein [Methylobacterium cerastii]GJD47165.1 hypothetical protein AFCDBAGC_5051 [Methylobacterium cerastii]
MERVEFTPYLHHLIVADQGTVNRAYLLPFGIPLRIIGSVYLRESIKRVLKVDADVFIEWVQAHCPSACWLHDSGRMTLVVPNENEAMEYKLRWL